MGREIPTTSTVMLNQLWEGMDALSIDVLKMNSDSLSQIKDVLICIQSAAKNQGRFETHHYSHQQERLKMTSSLLAIETLEFMIIRTDLTQVISTLSVILLNNAEQGVKQGVAGMSTVRLILNQENIIPVLLKLKTALLPSADTTLLWTQARKEQTKAKKANARRIGPLPVRQQPKEVAAKSSSNNNTPLPSSLSVKNIRPRQSNQFIVCEEIAAFQFRSSSPVPQFALRSDQRKVKELTIRRNNALEYGNAHSVRSKKKTFSAWH